MNDKTIKVRLHNADTVKRFIQVLLNGTGVIDSDYYNADNEGHMFIALKNDGDKSVTFEAGDRICQAVFVPFGITVDDNSDGVRTGGIGSTNK